MAKRAPEAPARLSLRLAGKGRTPESPHGSGDDDSRYLFELGARVREARARRGMTRRILAKDSGVSERYLALLESGRGNGSVLLLRQVARALDVPLDSLTEARDEPADFTQAVELLRRLEPEQLREAHDVLADTFGAVDRAARAGRIALIGLRGAGKTSLGMRVARAFGDPFLELDGEVERESRMSLSAIFDLYGQAGFRRFERSALENVIATRARFVLATGGGIVSEPATFARLRAACFTVWLRATPEEHMQRVVAQGDLRPIGGDKHAMRDLRRILSTREPLYREADLTFDTSGRTPRQCAEHLARVITHHIQRNIAK